MAIKAAILHDKEEFRLGAAPSIGLGTIGYDTPDHPPYLDVVGETLSLKPSAIHSLHLIGKALRIVVVPAVELGEELASRRTPSLAPGIEVVPAGDFLVIEPLAPGLRQVPRERSVGTIESGMGIRSKARHWRALKLGQPYGD